MCMVWVTIELRVSRGICHATISSPTAPLFRESIVSILHSARGIAELDVLHDQIERRKPSDSSTCAKGVHYLAQGISAYWAGHVTECEADELVSN